MIEYEFRVVSDHREGLLIGIAQDVIASGCTLLRQRSSPAGEGSLLLLTVRGTEANVQQLHARLKVNSLVQRVESAGESAAPGASASGSNPQAARHVYGASYDKAVVESLLQQVAREYPAVMPRLVVLDRELPSEQRADTMHHLGQRIGAWVYKRDYSLGAQFAPAETLRRIAQPAMSKLVNIEIDNEIARVGDSPFCRKDDPHARCHFLIGMLAGLVGGKSGAESVEIVETRCRSAGSDVCEFKLGRTT